MLMCIVSTTSFAYDIAVFNSQGIYIYYNYINDGTELEVVNGGDYYSPDVVGLSIPENVTYMDRTRKVTSIGNRAFEYCQNFTFVYLPNSITRIGINAFNDCDNLSYLNIPNSVTTIGSSAFWGCNKLETVDIGSNVTDIGSEAFAYCKSLTSVIIPEGVASINKSTFSGCKSLTSVTIPNSVKSIGEAAFENCITLSSVILPNNLTSIGNSAFSGCSRLTNITIPRSTTSIGNKTFEGINISTVVSKVIYPFPIVGKASDNRSFSKNTFNNATLYVPAGTMNKYKATDGWKDFLFIEEEEETSYINFADATVKAICIANWDTNGDGELSEVEAAAVTDLGTVFKTRSDIETFEELKYFTGLNSIGETAFFGCTNMTSITIPNSVTSIGVEAFHACVKLTSVTIPNSVSIIGDAAFRDCAFTSIRIPNSVKSIGISVFSRCRALTTIIVEEGNNKYDSRDNCNAIIETSTNTLIAGCKESSIPNGVTAIGDQAFRDIHGMTSVLIPSSVTNIGLFAFLSCGDLTSITIGINVTKIRTYAFYECNGLNTVTSLNPIPPTIEDNFTFSSYSATLQVPRGSKTAYQSAEYWKNFTNIVEIESENIIFADATVKAICVANWDTNGDGELNKTEAAAVTNLGTVFKNHTDIYSFEELKYFAGLTSISDGAFWGCSNMSSISIPDAVTSIDEAAFISCSNLTSITIPKKVTSIGKGAFFGCSSLSSVNIPEHITIIEEAVFQRCYNLTTIIIPQGVTFIGYRAFYACSSLSNITIPNNVTIIGDEAFHGCSSLTSLTSLNPTPPRIYEITFFTEYSATLQVPIGSKTAYQNAEYWRNFTNIVEIDPSGVQTIMVDKDINAPIYDLNGRKLKEPSKGINIIGRKKVVIK